MISLRKEWELGLICMIQKGPWSGRPCSSGITSWQKTLLRPFLQYCWLDYHCWSTSIFYFRAIWWNLPSDQVKVITGQIYCNIHSLYPSLGLQPRYAQIYGLNFAEATQRWRHNGLYIALPVSVTEIIQINLYRINPFAAALQHFFQVEQQEKQRAAHRCDKVPVIWTELLESFHS